MRPFSTTSFLFGGVSGALLVAAGWALSSVDFSLPLPESGPKSFAFAEYTDIPSGAISVTNQPAGDTVLIESVTVAPPGVWVAIRETNGESLGNILGAARVQGPRTEVSVPLLRATLPGLVYAAELYRDDGDGRFDLASDSVYIDFDTGSRVVARFITTE